VDSGDSASYFRRGSNHAWAPSVARNALAGYGGPVSLGRVSWKTSEEKYLETLKRGKQLSAA
jgi:hypothetical protein